MIDGYENPEGNNESEDASLESLESAFVPEPPMLVIDWCESMKARLDVFAELADMDGQQTDSEWNRRFQDWLDECD